MAYVDLNRYFFPIENEEQMELEYNRFWGKSLGGWLDWDELLKKKRVVLLAEASSGKTEEFNNYTRILLSQGKSAFFISIEELADEGFSQSLDPAAALVFEKWEKGFEEGFFFLDSVDEARLNRKRFDKALKKLSQKIFNELDRSRIFISCRHSDWKGKEDEEIIKQFLPVPAVASSEKEVVDPETALLGPIFNNQRNNHTEKNKEDEKPETDFIVVRLAPLDKEQQKELAQESDVEELSAFHNSIWQNGLEHFAGRPGDLLELAEYWKDYKKFGALSKMTEHAIAQKLSERDPYRPDNDTLSPEKAREGAERIAAALTLGKTFTLKAPGQSADPALAVGALDTKKVLNEWTDAERTVLLRRGIFSPATYGRVRFHHRGTQEYLTAQWMKKLLDIFSSSEVFKLIFSETYGVKTVVPSLRPASAWLSIDRSDIRDEILNRDPLILIQHGDPGFLPIETKRNLLRAYAEKHKAGDIANDSIDVRALWMFADPDLAESINEAWSACTRYDFRGDLLRLVREGSITGCSGLISKVALDPKASSFHRELAVQALVKLKSESILTRIADNLVLEAAETSAGLASSLACELFPDYLNVEQLDILISKTQPPNKGSYDGFGSVLKQLWENCPIGWRKKFVDGISELALSKPFVENYWRISKRYRFLAKRFNPIARELIAELGDNEPSDCLISLLMAMERVEDHYAIHEGKPPIFQLVQTRPKLNRALFWADVAEVRENRDQKKHPLNTYWGIFFSKGSLWGFNLSDLQWLYKDIENRDKIEDKRIVLSAIIKVLQFENKLDEEKEILREKLKQDPILFQVLEGYLSPPEETDQEKELRLRQEEHDSKQASQKAKDQESWKNFKDKVVGQPPILTNPGKNFSYIHDLSRWLRFRTNQRPEKALRQWHLLQEGFGKEVSLAYRDAMKMLWRKTKPERPLRKGSETKTKFANIYSYAGIGIEADEKSDWATHLTKEESIIAAKHACMTGEGYPEWLDDLMDVHPEVVLPVVKNEFRFEWKSKHDGTGYLLNRYSNDAFPINPQIATSIFETIVRTDPFSLNRLNCGLTILQRMDFSKNQIKRLKKMAITKFDHYLGTGEHKFVIQYLPLMFQIDPNSAFQCVENIIESANSDEQAALALKVFGGFRNDRRGAEDFFKNTPVSVLKGLVLRAYRHVNPNEDSIHNCSNIHGLRDDAESGCNTILSALLNRRGSEAYQAVIEISNIPEMEESAHRFRRLARDIAEQDSEFPAWGEYEIIKFEKKYISPVKTGADLYLLILSVLDEIRHQLDHGDASSKGLLCNADNEEKVQNWLAEQLILRSKDRYHVYREPEVSNKNKPDIIISGATAPVAVAIEVKQADSWSPNQLKKALTKQLSEDYLKPMNRRHGILFMTDHGRRDWQHPQTKKRGFSFEMLIIFLSDIASTITKNSTGQAKVSVFGIDATE